MKNVRNEEGVVNLINNEIDGSNEINGNEGSVCGARKIELDENKEGIEMINVESIENNSEVCAAPKMGVDKNGDPFGDVCVRPGMSREEIAEAVSIAINDESKTFTEEEMAKVVDDIEYVINEEEHTLTEINKIRKKLKKSKKLQQKILAPHKKYSYFKKLNLEQNLSFEITSDYFGFTFLNNEFALLTEDEELEYITTLENFSIHNII